MTLTELTLLGILCAGSIYINWNTIKRDFLNKDQSSSINKTPSESIPLKRRKKLRKKVS